MDTQYVVKGGTGPPPEGVWSIQTFKDAGVMVTGTTAHCKPGKTIAELAASTATPQVRVSTIKRIRGRRERHPDATRSDPAVPCHSDRANA